MNNLKLTLKLLRYLKPYAPFVTVFVVLSISSGLFDGISIALIIPTIQSIVADNVSIDGYSSFLRAISAPFMGLAPIARLQVLVLIILILTVLKNICAWLTACISRWLSYVIRTKVVANIFKQILEVEYGYISNKKAGELYSWLESESGRFGTAIFFLLQLITVAGVIVLYTLSMLAFSWRVTLVVMGPLVGLLLLTNVMNTTLRSLGERMSETGKAIFSYWIETLNGLRTIRLFGNYDYETKKHDTLWSRWNGMAMKKYIFLDMIKPGSETLVILILVVAIMVFAQGILAKGAQTLSLLLAFVYILKLLQIQINNFNSLAASYMAELPAVNVIEEALRKDNKPYLKDGAKRFSGFMEGIVFEGVGFRYPKSKAWALRNISFMIPKGKMTALVGSSGAGKSTLVDLVFRLYDPQEGVISIDGDRLTDLVIADWQSRLSFVSQDTFIFNASAYDNIAYGKLGASRDQIIEAAKKSNAHEFIEGLSAGYDTILGDKGIKLSGGQRQRIAIARAILKNPDILILDEATSALDTESEQFVQRAINDLSRNRTVLVIAHRLSTIEHADQVIVLEHGNIVETGNHKDLLVNNGRYAQLHYLQYKSIYQGR